MPTRALEVLPPLTQDKLSVTAQIDYIRAAFLPNKVSLPIPEDRVKWNRDLQEHQWKLTIQDPTRLEIEAVIERLGDPHIDGLEVAVDFWPLHELRGPAAHDLLTDTFVALAGRFRPDPKLLHGAGLKCAYSAAHPKGKPFHDRLAVPGETLVYGHRNEGENAKLYLKTKDNNRQLPQEDHRVRLEVTLARFGAYERNLGRWSSVLKKNLRATFGPIFCIVDRPEVRRPSRTSPAARLALEKRMQSVWDRAGVGGFDPGELPADASVWAKEAAAYRVPDLIALNAHRLRRHRAANRAIGNALYNLDRRLSATFSRGSA
jgi:hypothetical protein